MGIPLLNVAVLVAHATNPELILFITHTVMGMAIVSKMKQAPEPVGVTQTELFVELVSNAQAESVLDNVVQLTHLLIRAAAGIEFGAIGI